MELSDYLTPDHVILLHATTKVAALTELATILTDDHDGLDLPTLEQALWKREQMMSTGIGNALAIPHVRLPEVTTARIAVGVTPTGLADYASLDSEPITVVVMIVAPQGAHDLYVRLLAQVADVLKEPDLRKAIVSSTDPENIYRILTTGQI